MLVWHHFQQYFIYTVAVRFIGEGTQSTPTDLPQVIVNLYHIRFAHKYITTWAGFELTSLVAIGTDCMYSCKSNYHDQDSPHIFILNYILPYILVASCDQTKCVNSNTLIINKLVLSVSSLWIFNREQTLQNKYINMPRLVFPTSYVILLARLFSSVN
jgi:hypothetical protein